MKESLESEKKEVPQLNPKTGVSMDYFNEINAIFGSLLSSSLGLKFIEKMSKENSIYLKKYEEVYSEYSDVITDKNRKSIKRLDDLVGEINEILKNLKPENEAELREKCNEFYFLIYRNNDKKV